MKMEINEYFLFTINVFFYCLVLFSPVTIKRKLAKREIISDSESSSDSEQLLTEKHPELLPTKQQQKLISTKKIIKSSSQRQKYQEIVDLTLTQGMFSSFSCVDTF